MFNVISLLMIQVSVGNWKYSKRPEKTKKQNDQNNIMQWSVFCQMLYSTNTHRAQYILSYQSLALFCSSLISMKKLIPQMHYLEQTSLAAIFLWLWNFDSNRKYSLPSRFAHGYCSYTRYCISLFSINKFIKIL